MADRELVAALEEMTGRFDLRGQFFCAHQCATFLQEEDPGNRTAIRLVELYRTTNLAQATPMDSLADHRRAGLELVGLGFGVC